MGQKRIRLVGGDAIPAETGTKLVLPGPSGHVEAMMHPPTGIPIALEPLVLRVLAPNASPYTYTGTQSYVVGGTTDAAVIDPGPVDASHLDALLAAVALHLVGVGVMSWWWRQNLAAAMVTGRKRNPNA